MKITFVAPANNYHTQKWCEYFVSVKYEVSVISFFPGEIENVKVYHVDCGVSAGNSDGKKLAYLTKAGEIKKLIKKINPDIISVHYASSYGAAMALTGIKNYYLSVWGSDVYDFPEKSILHRMLIKYSLKRAGTILSTSKAMAKQVRKYTKKKVFVTPFGVDVNLFNPDKKGIHTDKLIIGTVKSLNPKYGIDYLIKAVGLFKKKNPDIRFQLRIAGDGPYKKEYEQLATDEGISKETVWLGFIPQGEVAKEWANMDIAVVPSVLDSESFGVSAVEAQACGTALIITDIPGLMEATDPGKTSIVVKRQNAEEIESAIELLAFDNDKRNEMGRVAVEFVKRRYEYQMCFERIEKILRNKK